MTSVSATSNSHASKIRNIAVFKNFQQISKCLKPNFGVEEEGHLQKLVTTLEHEDCVMHLVPAHLLFDCTSILRVTDNALIVIDCWEGVTLEVTQQLRQVMTERVRPLFLIDLDSWLNNQETNVDKEELYQSLQKVEESVNLCISTYHDPVTQQNALMDFVKGNVAFGSLKLNVFTTVPHIAKQLSASAGVNTSAFVERLWGNWFVDPVKKKWSKSPSAGTPTRTACHFILKSLLEKMVATKPHADNEALMNMILSNSVSPVQAQAYRTELMYTGSMKDGIATSIASCNPEGPLVVHIAKITEIQAKPNQLLVAFGKVFSGTLQQGQKVQMISNPSTSPTTAPRVLSESDPYDTASAGELFLFLEPPELITRGTLVSSIRTTLPFKEVKAPGGPKALYMTVEPTTPTGLTELLHSLKHLTKMHESLTVTEEPTGQHAIWASSEFHLESARTLLQEHCKAPLQFSETSITYRETVTTKSRTVLSKSPNKHNRIFMTAEPLDMAISTAIEAEEITINNASSMLQQFGWNSEAASSVWCFGADNTSAILCGTIKEQDKRDILNPCSASLQWMSREGILCDEPVRTTMFTLVDAVVFRGRGSSGFGQIVPTTRRAMYAAELLGAPTLMQPILQLEIQAPEAFVPAIYERVMLRRGVFISEAISGATLILKAHIPATESSGLETEIHYVSNKTAYTSMSFSHWERLSTETYHPELVEGKLYETITKTRLRKGLNPKMPLLTDLEDKL